MLYIRLLFTIFIINCCILLVNAGVGFLKDQKKCKISCQNGGVCAYEIGRPEIHRCICLKDIYYGDRCEYNVTAPPPTQRILITTTTHESTTHVVTQRPIKIVPHSVEREPEPQQEPVTLADEDVEDEGEESMESIEEDPNAGSSYVTLKEAENEEEEEEQGKMQELEKSTDDYIEPTESPEVQEPQRNIDVSNGYFEPDTQMHQYQSSKTTHSVEPDNVKEEEESGWMMVKKKSNFASRYFSFDLCKFVIFTAALFCQQYLF